jgi:hypothetical protein
LSADGTILGVGAPFNAGNGAQSGQVRAFEWVNSNWVQKGGDIDGEWAGEQSGKSVDLSTDGTRMVVGAILNDDAGSNAGQVRIFDFQTGSWQQLGNDINGDAAENELGSAVAINGDGTVVALGAKFKDGLSADIGQVRVLRYDSTDWQLIDAPIEGLMSGENSGASLGLSTEGGTFIVGAPQYNAVRGAARVYQNSSYLATDLVADELSAVSCQKLAAGQYRLVFPMMKDYDLRIYDRYGRLHYSKSLTNKGTYILDQSLVSSGIYFVQVLSNEDQWTGKLLFP